VCETSAATTVYVSFIAPDDGAVRDQWRRHERAETGALERNASAGRLLRTTYKQ